MGFGSGAKPGSDVEHPEAGRGVHIQFGIRNRAAALQLGYSKHPVRVAGQAGYPNVVAAGGGSGKVERRVEGAKRVVVA